MTDIKHYLQQPSLKNHNLAFVSEDDLWICDLNNMRSQRLTTDFGEIKNPHISPCGQHIAFSSNREGSIEVYVISISGGNPKKLTYTGDSCLVTGWKDPDTIIVSSTFERPFRQGSLYTIAKNGGDLCEINVGPANTISYGVNGNTMVIQRHGYGYPSWKRYRGGTCAELWLKRSKSRKFSLFCKQNANMIQPVLYKNRVYFISDFQGHGNVYSANLDGLDIRRHTNCEGFYVRCFSIDQDRIVYAQAGQLFSIDLDLKSATPPSAKQLSIETASILHHTTRKYDFSEKSLEDISPNHNASQLALCHRGRLFTMPTFQGPATLIDNNDQKRYRHCCWLQKTSSIFAICDDGHHDFPVIFDQQKPESKPKKWQKLDLGKVLCLQPSPNSKHILLANQRHELLLLDSKTGKLKTIAHSAFATIGQFDWSEDGQWLCYRLANSHETAKIMLYNVKKDSHTEITRGHYNDYSPCFDPDGKYLYFLSHRSLTPKS